MTTVATATTRVSENARHATTPLESPGCRARKPRNAAQRFGQAETYATTPIHPRRTSPWMISEPGRETIHRPTTSEDAKRATLVARRSAARWSARAQDGRTADERREGMESRMIVPTWRTEGP